MAELGINPAKKRPIRAVTEANWSGAAVDGVLSFRELGVLRDRLSVIPHSGFPLSSAVREVEWFGGLGAVWKVVGANPSGVASVFTTRVRAQVAATPEAKPGPAPGPTPPKAAPKKSANAQPTKKEIAQKRALLFFSRRKEKRGPPVPTYHHRSTPFVCRFL